MARVILEQVSKRFGDVKAVDSLNLDIRDKEFVTLVGPSGCGKTTTLRLIAGLEKVTDGAIYFDEQVVSHLPANHRDIAMVFQSYALYPHMNVYDNISFALRMMKIARSEIDRRVKWAANLLGIELLNRKPRELSGGQRQRVALGRAIVREPACFLLDEPLSNLDAKFRVTIRAELKRLHHDIGRTFIYVTHDQAEALTMSDRIAIMNHGLLQQYGTPDEVYNQPANLFVAGFIGSPAMNFIEGELTREGGQLTFRRNALHYPIPASWAQRLAQQNLPGGQVTLGARPEAIGITAKMPPGVGGTVYVEEPLGSDVFLTVDVDGVNVIVRTTPEFHAAIGSQVKLHLNPDKVYFFSTESGQAVR